MGARWAWEAVCPNLHIYGNFSGGADPCYDCGLVPEVEFTEGPEGYPTPYEQAQEYVARRRSGKAVEDVAAEDEVALLHRLADKLGYEVSQK